MDVTWNTQLNDDDDDDDAEPELEKSVSFLRTGQLPRYGLMGACSLERS